jgi:hypothetical protein
MDQLAEHWKRPGGGGQRIGVEHDATGPCEEADNERPSRRCTAESGADNHGICALDEFEGGCQWASRS